MLNWIVKGYFKCVDSRQVHACTNWEILGESGDIGEREKAFYLLDGMSFLRLLCAVLFLWKSSSW